ncbi:dihydroorotate dehydrogenase electron transfer subunit [Bacillus spongiae]|uniref:Dihydroorotate dehydrogenase B (NAD(+)), electron transfer subunit n=1 Tax=Bacillus spongiae TaxID=2683610 RepID=A0ABU8HAC9_9BACI
MMRKERMKIKYHQEIAYNIYELVLEGELVGEMKEPGQFVHLKVGETDPLLRRPISIAAIDRMKKQCTLIYRKEGKGTTLLSSLKQDEYIDVLGPLGNGFPIDGNGEGKTALLVGGGIGVPPLYELSKQLVKKGFNVIHVLGFQNQDVAFYIKEFSLLGSTYIATVDGDLGVKGFVTDCIKEHNLEFDMFYACGPTVMLKALEAEYGDRKGYISLEERMGCGVGACFACVCHTAEDPNGTSYKKVCSDGPVFSVGEVVL